MTDFDFKNAIAEASSNMQKCWNAEDRFVDTIENIIKDWLMKQAQNMGSDTLSFTLKDIWLETNRRINGFIIDSSEIDNRFDGKYLRYADTFFYVQKALDELGDDADQQGVDLKVEQTTDLIYTIRLIEKD